MKNYFWGVFLKWFSKRTVEIWPEVSGREREDDRIGKDSRGRIQTRDTRSAIAWTHSCNIMFLSDWSDDVFCRGLLVRLQFHLNINDSHYSGWNVTQAQVCVKALHIWLNNSTVATEVVNIIRVPPHLGTRLRDRNKVMLHVNQDAAAVCPRQHLSISYECHPSCVEYLRVCLCVCVCVCLYVCVCVCVRARARV